MSLLIIAPPRGQRSPNSLRRSWVSVPSLVMICQRAAEKSAYFLFGGFAVKFDWLSRPNGLELEKAVWHVCSACSEDQI